MFLVCGPGVCTVPLKMQQNPAWGDVFVSVRCWGVVKVDVKVDAAASRWGRRSPETHFGVVRVDVKVGAAAPH